MLKIVLVDDERIVLKGISKAIQRERGFYLAGTAENGIDGLKMITEMKPDIVLTDIRMPGMNGLELIRNAKRILPNAVYIVFSGFNEFKYVKEAIGLNVIDYIEKPVTITKLHDVLKKAKDIYQYQENYADLTKNMKKAERVCIEKSLRDLCEQSEQEENCLNQILENNRKLIKVKTICVLKIVEAHSQSVDDYRRAVQRLTFDLIHNNPVQVYSFFQKENMVLVYFNMGEMNFPFFERITNQKKKIEEDNIIILAGISRIHKDIYQLKNAFEEADHALSYARYLEASEVVRIEEVEYANSIPCEISQHHKSLEFDFRIGQYDDCRKQIKEYIQYMKNMELLPELFMQKCWELIFLLNQMLRESGDFQSEDTEVMYAELGNFVSGEQIANWTIENTEQIIKQAEKVRNTGGSRATKIVKQYIEKHYAEGISLDEIAEQVHMSNTYLSMLFKKEEGITYIKYLTQVRMEKAMELLKKGLKAKEVCGMVGYHDYKHFSTQFKAFTGMTLDHYKKMN